MLDNKPFNGASLNTFFYPKSIAIIGASKDEKKVGYQILDNVIVNGYQGEIFPINLKEQEIHGKKAYANIADVPAKIDLVVIVVPAEYVLDEIKKCVFMGAKNIIIISAGFSEEGGVGKIREIKIQELAKKHKLNILGPNCFGIINTACDLNATFAKSKNKKGRIAFVSQSGAICAAVLDWAGDKPCGFSKFVSIGNKAVLDENDFFEYFAKDEETDIVVAYLEEVRNGKRFMNAVSKLAKIKPVAILKAGQSDAGATAAMSHTGSMAGSNEAVMAGFKRAGVINLENIEEMFDLLLFYSKKRTFENNNVALISNAGGPMVATVDLLSKKGIELKAFPADLKKKMGSLLPPIVKVKNPLDLIGDATAERYKVALESLAQSGEYSIILTLLTPQSSTQIDETAKIIADMSEKHQDKIFVASFIGGTSTRNAKEFFSAKGVINFDFPNKAVEIISKIIEYRTRLNGLKVYKDTEQVGEIRTRKEQMDYVASLNLLKKYGITTVNTVKIKHKNDLEKLKYPVALKVVGKNLIHKTDKKAIALNVKNKEEAVGVIKNFKKLLSDNTNYCVAQPMTKGLEMIAGLKKDKSFGHMVVVGMGGIYAEVFKDIQIEVDDIDETRALQMIEKLKMHPILAGARGQSAYDIKAVVKLLVNLAKLARNNHKVQELDINPLFVTDKGAFAADIRIIF